MALISCPECEKQVSTSAEVCPHCGYPVSKMNVSASAPLVEPVKTSSNPETITDGAESPVEEASAPSTKPKTTNATLWWICTVVLGVGGPAAAVAGYQWWQKRAAQQEWEQEWKQSEAAKLKAEEERARLGYYCFVIEANDKSSRCMQGLDACNDFRLDGLRTVSGVTVSECAWTKTVFAFKFACKANPGATCYVARQTLDECEVVRTEYIGTANNLTSCAAVREADAERTTYGYYCFKRNSGHPSNDCLKSLESCNQSRLIALRAVSGATVSECARTEEVFQFEFACTALPNTTCYQARPTLDECILARSAVAGTVNKLTACAAAGR